MDELGGTLSRFVADVEGALLAPARRRREARRQLGEWLGLDGIKAGDVHLTGSLGRLGVRITTRQDGKQGSWRTVCQVRLREALPVGVKIDRPTFMSTLLDRGSKERVVGPQPVLKRLLGESQRREQLRASRRFGDVAFNCDLVQADAAGSMIELAQWGRAVLDLACFLDQRWGARGEELTEMGLVQEEGRWVGTIGTIHVVVDEHQPRRGVYRSVVHTRLTPSLPRRTRVQRRELEHGEEDVLGDLILDSLLVSRTRDRRELAKRLGHDSVRGPLLEVVHGHPGSRVERHWVHLHVDGSLCGLTPSVRLAVELAEELQRSAG